MIRYHDIRQGIYHNLTQNDDVKAFLKETYGDGRARAGTRWVGSGRGPKSQRFSITNLSKIIDFERRAGSGAAGDRKVNGFH